MLNPPEPLGRLLLAALLIAWVGNARAQPPSTTPQVAPPSAELAEAETRHMDHLAHGRYADAVPFGERVLALQEQRLGPDRSDTLVAALNLADDYKAVGRYSEAEALLIRALEVSQRRFGSDNGFTRTAVDQLAALYREQGRYADAEQVYHRAIDIFVRVHGPAHTATLISTYGLARLYQDQGRHDEAAALLREALEATERERGRDHRNTLETASRLADLYRAQGRYGDAEPLARRAVAGFDRAGGHPGPDALQSFVILASIYQAQGRHAEAEPLFRRALAGYEQSLGDDHPETLAAADRLAGLYLAAHRYGEARTLLRRTLAGRERVLGSDSPGTLDSFESLLIARSGTRLDAQGTVALARRFLAALRSRRNGGADQRARAQREREFGAAAGRFALFADITWTATAATGQRGAMLPEAFGALQDSVSGAADRAIAEQAGQRYARGRAPALAALIDERQRKQDEWTALDNRLAQVFGEDPSATSDRPAVIRQELDRVQARITAIDAQLMREAPDYFTLIQPQPVGIEAARSLLDSDEAILLAIPSRFGTHVMVVTRAGIDWSRSDWTAEQVRRAVQRLRWDAGASVDGTSEELARLSALPHVGRPGFDRTTAHALYRGLVGPVAGQLAGKRRIYVAAGGALAGLPFQLLVAAPPEGADNDPAALRATHWFGDDFALVHIPSVQALARLRRTSPNPQAAGFVGIGDPVLEGRGSARRRGSTTAPLTAQQVFRAGRSRDGGLIADLGALRRLTRLPGTARELELVRRTLHAPPGSLMLAERATEANVRAADLSRARIILFSTHGLTAAESLRVGLGEGGLVLTPPAVARDGDDGYLAASEVTTLRLNADWVILSACNTATGDGLSGSGLGELARAFFFAGARNLLASHWPVSDEVAPILINRTLALERTGIPRAEAFRRATRQIRMNRSHDTVADSWAHPFYWAPFVLIGDGGR
jgi:CHAT domain-containing protein/tetratricopeptide (TPR) repeat protein